MNIHNARYICGYCKKETPLTDVELLRRIDGAHPPDEFKSPCSCGHFSYASSIRFKAQMDPKFWRGVFRGSIE